MTARRRSSGPGEGRPAGAATPGGDAPAWEFKARFRRHAFGWRPQPAITRIKQAVAEIRKFARKDPVGAAEGAVMFLERVSPAIEHVDGSSGSIGTAVRNAVAELVPIIAGAPADVPTRAAWLERLWNAYEADKVPYIESLGDRWGALCATEATASAWADRLIGPLRRDRASGAGSFASFKGATSCLSALLAAGRCDEVLALLGGAHSLLWHYRRYGVKALSAMGRKEEAIRYAEERRGLADDPVDVARECEEALLSEGQTDEAYRRYGLLANARGSYLATFRAMSKRYPHKPPGEILDDLVASTPGEEGKWFAAAKDAGFFAEAITLATRSPCDPTTLLRAARDQLAARPAFAASAGLLALHWMAHGHGYEIDGADVWYAYRMVIAAAERMGCVEDAKARIRKVASASTAGARLIAALLGRELGLGREPAP